MLPHYLTVPAAILLWGLAIQMSLSVLLGFLFLLS